VHCAHRLKCRFAAAIATSKGINVIPIFRRVVSGPNETFVERLLNAWIGIRTAASASSPWELGGKTRNSPTKKMAIGFINRSGYLVDYAMNVSRRGAKRAKLLVSDRCGGPIAASLHIGAFVMSELWVTLPYAGSSPRPGVDSMAPG
jgi:hypothetical protein